MMACVRLVTYSSSAAEKFSFAVSEVDLAPRTLVGLERQEVRKIQQTNIDNINRETHRVDI
jgi:hypothetical protein